MKKPIAISLFCTALVFLAALAQAGEPVGHGFRATFPLKAKVPGDAASGQEFSAVTLGEHGKMSCTLFLPKEKEDRDLNTLVALDVDRVTESPAATSGYVAYVDGTFSVGGQPTHASMACTHPDPELGTAEFMAYLQALAPAPVPGAPVEHAAAPAPAATNSWQKTVIDILPASIYKTPVGTAISIEVAPGVIAPGQQDLVLQPANPRTQAAGYSRVYEGRLFLHIPSYDGGQRNFPGGRIELTLISRPEASGRLGTGLPGVVKLNGASVDDGELSFVAPGNDESIETLKDFIETNGGTFTLGPWSKEIDDSARRRR